MIFFHLSLGTFQHTPGFFHRSLIHLFILSESFHSGTLGYLGGPMFLGVLELWERSWKLGKMTWKMLRKKNEFQVEGQFEGQFDRPDNFERRSCFMFLLLDHLSASVSAI